MAQDRNQRKDLFKVWQKSQDKFTQILFFCTLWTKFLKKKFLMKGWKAIQFYTIIARIFFVVKKISPFSIGNIWIFWNKEHFQNPIHL